MQTYFEFTTNTIKIKIIDDNLHIKLKQIGLYLTINLVYVCNATKCLYHKIQDTTHDN